MSSENRKILMHVMLQPFTRYFWFIVQIIIINYLLTFIRENWKDYKILSTNEQKIKQLKKTQIIVTHTSSNKSISWFKTCLLYLNCFLILYLAPKRTALWETNENLKRFYSRKKNHVKKSSPTWIRTNILLQNN